MKPPPHPIKPPTWFSIGERQVLELIKQARPNKEIADKLHVSVATVKARLYSLFRKTGCQDRLELMLWCIQHAEDVELGYTRNPGLLDKAA
jgi:DNA-binding NarL/FixJ family response regulator